MEAEFGSLRGVAAGSDFSGDTFSTAIFPEVALEASDGPASFCRDPQLLAFAGFRGLALDLAFFRRLRLWPPPDDVLSGCSGSGSGCVWLDSGAGMVVFSARHPAYSAALHILLRAKSVSSWRAVSAARCPTWPPKSR